MRARGTQAHHTWESTDPDELRRLFFGMPGEETLNVALTPTAPNGCGSEYGQVTTEWPWRPRCTTACLPSNTQSSLQLPILKAQVLSSSPSTSRKRGEMKRLGLCIGLILAMVLPVSCEAQQAGSMELVFTWPEGAPDFSARDLYLRGELQVWPDGVDEEGNPVTVTQRFTGYSSQDPLAEWGQAWRPRVPELFRAELRDKPRGRHSGLWPQWAR